MRKNILGALVIFIVTVAIMLMIDDISTNHRTKDSITTEQHDNLEKADYARNGLGQ